MFVLLFGELGVIGESLQWYGLEWVCELLLQILKDWLFGMFLSIISMITWYFCSAIFINGICLIIFSSLYDLTLMTVIISE
jgi:hypothetical protein